MKDMKVKDLIALLQTLPPDALVVLYDSFNTEFSRPLLGYDLGHYNDSDNEFGLAELTEEDEKAGYSEEDIVKGVPAVAFYAR